MRTLLKKIFINNWPRKLVSFILAIIIWILVSHSMSATKTFHNVPVKIINIPPGKTIEGLQDNLFLNKPLTITLTGNKNVLEDLTGADLEIILNAEGKSNDWIIYLNPKNLVCLNPDIDIQKSVSKIVHPSIILKITDITTQKIPIHVTQPIGEAPKGFLFLDIWPYQLYVTVSGPTEVVNILKTKGLKLTFNLNDISKKELEQTLADSSNQDTISFQIPNSWKKMSLPMISSTPIEIDDPQAKFLKIDFAKHELLPLERAIPITLFYPVKTSNTLNPDTFTLATNDFIKKKNGIKMITQPLFAHGVSRLFLDIVKDMLQIVIIATSQNSKESPLWNVQFIYPHKLEDRFVEKIMQDASNVEFEGVQPHLREEYLRNRFRSYMNRFRIFTPENQKLLLDIRMDANTIQVTPRK